MRENVAITESIPVCGVAIRKETVAPFDAPSFLRDMAVGITPHEHNGSGIPKREAHKTERNDGLPRNLPYRR